MVIGDFLFLILAIGFFLFMSSIASTSTDPAELMRTVGSVSGVVGGISIILILLGLVGKKV
jgi:hypothetical protein